MEKCIVASEQNTPVFNQYPSVYFSAYKVSDFGQITHTVKPIHLDWGYWKFASNHDTARAKLLELNSPEDVIWATRCGMEEGIGETLTAMVSDTGHLIYWDDLSAIKLVWIPGRLDGTKGWRDGEAASASEHMVEITKRRERHGLPELSPQQQCVYTGTYFRWYLEAGADLKHVRKWINHVPEESLHLEAPTAESIIAGFPEWQSRSLFGEAQHMSIHPSYLPTADRRLKPIQHLRYRQGARRALDAGPAKGYSCHPAWDGATEDDYTDFNKELNSTKMLNHHPERWLKPPAVLNADGEVMLDPQDSKHEILDYPNLPARIPNKRWFDREQSWQRLDKRITQQDCDARRLTCVSGKRKRQNKDAPPTSTDQGPQDRRKFKPFPNRHVTDHYMDGTPPVALEETTSDNVGDVEGRIAKRSRLDCADSSSTSNKHPVFDYNMSESIWMGNFFAAYDLSSGPASVYTANMGYGQDVPLNFAPQPQRSFQPSFCGGFPIDWVLSMHSHDAVNLFQVANNSSDGGQNNGTQEQTNGSSFLNGVDSPARVQTQEYPQRHAYHSQTQQINPLLGVNNGAWSSGGSSVYPGEQIAGGPQGQYIDENINGVPTNFDEINFADHPLGIPVTSMQLSQLQPNALQPGPRGIQFSATAQRNHGAKKPSTLRADPVQYSHPYPSDEQEEQILLQKDELRAAQKGKSAGFWPSTTADSPMQMAQQSECSLPRQAQNGDDTTVEVPSNLYAQLPDDSSSGHLHEPTTPVEQDANHAEIGYSRAVLDDSEFDAWLTALLNAPAPSARTVPTKTTLNGDGFPANLAQKTGIEPSGLCTEAVEEPAQDDSAGWVEIEKLLGSCPGTVAFSALPAERNGPADINCAPVTVHSPGNLANGSAGDVEAGSPNVGDVQDQGTSNVDDPGNELGASSEFSAPEFDWDFNEMLSGTISFQDTSSDGQEGHSEAGPGAAVVDNGEIIVPGMDPVELACERCEDCEGLGLSVCLCSGRKDWWVPVPGASL